MMGKLSLALIVLLLVLCVVGLAASIDAALRCQHCGWDGNVWLGPFGFHRGCYRETATEECVTIRETVPFLEAMTIYCLEAK